jgi:hypothetical protein
LWPPDVSEYEDSAEEQADDGDPVQSYVVSVLER